jgi:phosphomevalonate kinase
MIEARAPGKLMLFGEYAVLARGVAIVAAVDRFVHAWIDDAAPGYKAIGGPELSRDTALPCCVLAATGCSAAWLERLGCDVSALFEGGKKLGLGSSAASVVALVRAVRAARGLPDDARATFDAAFVAHRALQRGRGSNADIAASAFGGLIRYQLDAPQTPFEALGSARSAAGPLVERLPGLPQGYAVHAIWLGEPASSTQLIGAIERALSGAQAGRVHKALEELDASARDADAAIMRGDGAALVAEALRSDEALEALGAASAAPIITPAHRALRLWAARAGRDAAVKPSGAGGGDFSLLFAPDDMPLDGLPSGCQHIALKIV